MIAAIEFKLQQSKLLKKCGNLSLMNFCLNNIYNISDNHFGQ